MENRQNMYKQRKTVVGEKDTGYQECENKQMHRSKRRRKAKRGIIKEMNKDERSKRVITGAVRKGKREIRRTKERGQGDKRRHHNTIRRSKISKKRLALCRKLVNGMLPKNINYHYHTGHGRAGGIPNKPSGDSKAINTSIDTFPSITRTLSQ